MGRTLFLPCVSASVKCVTHCAGLQGAKREQIVMVLPLVLMFLTLMYAQIEVGDGEGKLFRKQGRADEPEIRRILCRESLKDW